MIPELGGVSPEALWQALSVIEKAHGEVARHREQQPDDPDDDLSQMIEKTLHDAWYVLHRAQVARSTPLHLVS